jgi:hypothetical protein
MKKRKMKESTVQLLGALFFFLWGTMLLIGGILDVPICSYYGWVNWLVDKLGVSVVCTACALFCYVLSGVCVKQAFEEQKNELKEASVSDT